MEITIRVVCSKGTYIRALARDIGEALHSGAHLTALRRTRVGDYTIDKCFSDVEAFETYLKSIVVTEDDKMN
jgi:tRNA pseudouridine55 synthase